MSSGNSSRRRRGPKPARCPTSDESSSGSSSSTSMSSSSDQSRVQFGSSFSSESSMASSRTDVSSDRMVGSVVSLASAECSVVAPDLTVNPGDNKKTFYLSDKGKLVMITRKSGDLVYMLRCVDGRRVYIEKSQEGASLILTNQKGKVIKALAGQY